MSGCSIRHSGRSPDTERDCEGWGHPEGTDSGRRAGTWLPRARVEPTASAAAATGSMAAVRWVQPGPGPTGMDFRILGPLEVLDEDGTVALAGSRQRALLTLLLLHANEALTTDRLIDELWGERPPASAAKTVQVQISRLRKALGDEAGRGSAGLHCDARARLRAEARSQSRGRAPLRAAGGRGPERVGGRPAGTGGFGARGGALAVARPGAGGTRLRAVRTARGSATR